MEGDTVSGSACTDPTPARDPSLDVHTVPIAELEPADSPRLSGEDTEHIRRLTEVEAPLPPILVHRSAMRVIDGMHRLRAAALTGRRAIDVVFFDGTEEDAFIRAVEENTAHGLPLSLADRRAAAARIVVSHPHLSDRIIAARTGLSAGTIGSIRRSTGQASQSNERIGADGRRRSLDGAEGRRLAAAAIAARPDAPLREIAKAAGIAVSTAHDVRTRLLRGQDPIPKKYTSAAKPAQPPATPARPNARPRRGTEVPDRAILLQRLMKDPSLRQTDPGRELLRLLNSRTISAEESTELLNAVPAHCREVVAEVARLCAETWHQFAEELERRPVTGPDAA
jgi:ParB-like chromosome segregation protein Spo0J